MRKPLANLFQDIRLGWTYFKEARNVRHIEPDLTPLERFDRVNWLVYRAKEPVQVHVNEKSTLLRDNASS